MTARSLRCTFGPGAQASWDAGKAKVEKTSWGDSGPLVYDALDLEAGTGRIIGNQGAADVPVLVTPMGITIIEGTAAGGLNFTTIFPRRPSTGFPLFTAVMSRHLDINGPFPSQFHGTCEVLEP